MKIFLTYTLPAIILISIIAACQKDYEPIEVLDSRNVATYIQKNNLNVTEYEDSGVYYQVLEPGTGPEVDYSDQVPVILTIKSLDGQYVALDTFANGNRYYNYLGYFTPAAIRTGIKEVLQRSSGSIRMIIPSRLAFGRNGTAGIPGNASLDLMVRVLDKDKMAEYEDFTIQKYMAANNLTGFSKTESGLYYKISEEGTGSPITSDSSVVAEYTGKLLNGKVFDGTKPGGKATFSLRGVIGGWREAIPLIKEGGSIEIIMPSALGYGFEGSGSSVPPFSCLHFTVKVVEVKLR
jgi:FKBP-type peptidyl-prolyl cis-trans isomerase FkpA